MKTKYTAGEFRRNERRIRRNAKTVVDNTGCTMKITRSRRILEILNPMTGKWEGPTSNDGVRYSGSPYIYVPEWVNLSPAIGL
jgi:hypothetical protein